MLMLIGPSAMAAAWGLGRISQIPLTHHALTSRARNSLNRITSPPFRTITTTTTRRPLRISSALYHTSPSNPAEASTRVAGRKKSAKKTRPAKKTKAPNNRNIDNNKNSNISNNLGDDGTTGTTPDVVENASFASSFTVTAGRGPDEHFVSRALVNHEILTAAEELECGLRMKRAAQLQQALEACLAEKQEQHQKQQNDEDDEESFDSSLDSPSRDWLPDEMNQGWDGNESEDLFDDADEFRHLFVYGMQRWPATQASYSSSSSSSYQSMYRLYDTPSASTQAYDLEEHELVSFMTAKTRHAKQLELESMVSTAYDAEDSEDETYPEASWNSWLTDEDVIQTLGLPGGKQELTDILMQGSLARDKLIRSNARLVLGIAKRWARMPSSSTKPASTGDVSLHSIYSGSWDRPSLNEVVQEGLMGLIKATERFDPNRGLRFSTYATHWVTSHVRSCFQRTSTGCLRLPTNYYEVRTRFKSLVKQYYEMQGQVPSFEVMSRQLKISPSRLRRILTLTRPLVSTDAPLGPKSKMRAGKAGNEEETEVLLADTLVDTELEPMQMVELSFLRQSLENAMASELAPYERDVVRLRLGLDDGISRSCKQVAQEYGGGLTSSEVRSAERRALKKLRSPHALATYKLLAYLDVAGVDGSIVNFRR